MSRLYIWIDSDTRKTILTSRANEKLNIRVNYGSKDNSIGLIDIDVYYPHTKLPDDKSTPKVFVRRYDK